MKKYLLQVRLCRCFEAWVSMHSSRKGVYSFYQVPRKQKKVLVAQSCLTLCDPMDCSLLGSSVHGILQARMLEWVAMPFSRISSQLGDWIGIPCTTGRFFTHWATWEALKYIPNFLTNRGLCGQGMLLVIPGNKKNIASHSSSTKVKPSATAATLNGVPLGKFMMEKNRKFYLLQILAMR